MTILAAGRTDIGTKRETNQDTIAWHLSADGQSALAIVADGMGGYEGGEIASQLAADTVMDTLKPTLEHPPEADDQITELIQEAITLANERIRTVRNNNPALSKMGTTLVLAWVHNNTGHIAHLGDSRCYLLSGTQLTQLTRDDTVAQNMVDDGSIKQEEVPRVPFRNMLTRALGSDEDATATFRQLTLEPDDRLILCSDGLTDAVPDSDWQAVIGGCESLGDQATRLVETSLGNQAADNVSVLLIQSF